MNRGERVFVNTLALYLRMVVSVVPMLLASRFILATLGASDYGVYGVVGGIVGFMGFLNSAMASGSQRHLAFELGRGDTRQVERVFSACAGSRGGLGGCVDAERFPSPRFGGSDGFPCRCVGDPVSRNGFEGAKPLV
jgi:hypothetical protein